MSNIKNIFLVGVGGQGTILTSKILSKGFVENGYDVKMAEIHGMSQRGGSVTTQIRYGEKVYSPVIEKGSADIIVAFEKSEALRFLDYLKEDGILVINTQEIYPVTVNIGASKYPNNIIEEYDKVVGKKNVNVIDAYKIAGELGNIKCMNIVLLGALVKMFKLENINWKQIIKDSVPEKAIEMNINAFDKGYEI
ncbi:indolepyruvate oxidoreductase subunit beta [Sedimentibacter sp. zth1]|uniref:indolepyruvate oxidoreductase subunit beta n=1 Tax=Sedimentibacter sp. zth1 TaxID=2816908 RepID=UPI001A922641|nr:indolepyruvate oxidoreductase subunit beta [Sedimentibacter sp. zth1]QSX06367.1 indolepyruvate oxidoreductase subunit beta [Sedimentibacter sp. zth1]